MRTERALVVEAVGPQALLQDGGRPGFAHLGVTRSGAADRAAWAAANRLVGNDPRSACIEVVGGGLVVRATTTLLLGVAGAPGLVSVGGAQHPVGFSFTLAAGETAAVGPSTAGLRTYLAVRGGFVVDPTLGSRSTDVLSGLGPPPIRQGDALPVGTEVGPWPAADFVLPFADGQPAADEALPIELPAVRGPRDEWFGDPGWSRLLHGRWRVSAQANRVGLRLEPDSDEGAQALERPPGFGGELPSEGMVAGAIQVPPDGHPVVFFRDHPVTGGYPVIGVIASAALDRLGQLRPGDPVRFTEVSPE